MKKKDILKKILHRTGQILLLCFIFFLPIILFAQGTRGTVPGQPWAEAPRDFKEFTSVLIEIMRLIIPILVIVALGNFFLGIGKVIGNAGNEEKLAEGKKFMIWGIIGLFVMASVWGIVGLLTNAYNLPLGIPLLPTHQ